MKIGDFVYDYAQRVGIITKLKASRDWVWVEMMWEHDSHGFRPLGEHNRSGWYDVRDLEMYHESR